MTQDNLRNDLVQAALIAYGKTLTNVTNLLADQSSEEIREDQWQATTFIYPNIRLRLMTNTPDADCDRNNITLSWEVRSEQSSSYEADKICGTISAELHNKPFSSNGLNIRLYTTNNVPAIREDTRTWRSECLMRGQVSG